MNSCPLTSSQRLIAYGGLSENAPTGSYIWMGKKKKKTGEGHQADS